MTWKLEVKNCPDFHVKWGKQEYEIVIYINSYVLLAMFFCKLIFGAKFEKKNYSPFFSYLKDKSHDHIKIAIATLLLRDECN